MEFRDYVAILGGLVGILATFTGIMWMLVQQINKRIDTVEKRIDDRTNAVEKRIDDRINAVEKRIDELRDDMDRRFNELRDEIKEIKLLLYKVLEVPHKQGE
jgi:predicted PurR-regulated permease PerM